MDNFYKALRAAVIANAALQIMLLVLSAICINYNVSIPFANAIAHCSALSVLLAFVMIVLLATSFFFKKSAQKPSYYYFPLAITQLVLPVFLLFCFRGC